jgi:peptide/nickel transport system substrate-binding protein/oligopeptide transport system substrate-binding protein
MLKLKKLFFPVFFALLAAGCKSSPVQTQEQEFFGENKYGLIVNNQLNINDQKDDFAEMRPQIQDRDELTVVFSTQDVELDFRKSYFASEAQIFTGLYEGLFSYHPLTLEPVPAAVDRWELSADKMQWTFTIRQNARYWNGDHVRAEDFRTAWLTLLEPSRASPYSGLFDIIEGARDYRNGIEKDPDKVGIHVPNSRTLVVKLNAPASFFPAMLCHHSFSPIHPDMVNRDSWSPLVNQKDWMPPVSNGPFRIESMDKEKIVMIKNDWYWDNRRVNLNKITVKFTETAEDASYLWNSGEARWIAGNVDVEALTDRSGIQLNVMFATHYYYVRSEVEPWSDHRIRRAMALVLPWDEIRTGYYLPAKTLIYPVAGYPEVKGISETNYEEARELMVEAGFPDGSQLPELVIRLTPSEDAARIGGLMAVAWKEALGFNVRVEVIPYERYFQSMKESGYTIGSSTWIGDFADPYTFLQIWRRDSNLNDACLYDEEYEALIEKSMLEEGNERMTTLSQAEELLLDRGVVLPVFYHPALNIVDTGELDGWYPNALDIHPFKYFSFKTYRPLPGVAMAHEK